MSEFHYKAYDAEGQRVSGQLQSASRDSALQALRHQGLTPVEIHPLEKKLTNLSHQGQPLSAKDLEFFVVELALLLRNKIKLDRAIEITLQGIEKPGALTTLQQVLQDVRQGISLSESLSRHPESFDMLMINMVKAGESTGNLSVIFSRIAQNLKFRKKIARQVQNALIYPAFILVVCIGVILFVFNFIVPRLTTMFDGMQSLPVYTEILLTVTDWVIRYQLFIGAGLILFAMIIYKASQKRASRARLFRTLSAMPIIGKFILRLECLRYTSAMSLLLSESMALVDAMQLSASSVQSPDIQAQLQAAREQVKSGKSLSETLSETQLFSGNLLSMIEVGEESGSLADIFSEITERLSEDFELLVTRLTSLLEPLLIVFMGLLVGSVVVIMLLSIVSVDGLGI